MRRALGMALVTALLVGGCTAPGPTGALEWGGCADFGQPEQPGTECAWLTVPLDRSQPDGRTARIGVLRHRATGDRLGTLVWNAGGAEHNMTAVRDLAASGDALLDRFDVVGFDRRAVGASTPTVHCYTTADWTADRARPATPAARDRAYRDACVRRTGTATLRTVGVDTAADDLDALRNALGEKQISYYGASSGTRLGMAYAERHGGSLAALVLDSAVPVVAADPVTGSADPVSGATTLGRIAERGYQAFAADCRRHPDCPQQTVGAVLRRAPVPVGTRTLSYADAWAAVRYAVLDAQRYGALRTGLADLATGHGAALLRLADTAYGATPDGGMPDTYDSATALVCSDSPRYSAAQVAAADRAYLAATPSLADGLGEPNVLGVCARWPTAPGYLVHVPSAPALRSALVVADTHDPVTPYASSAAVARGLRAPVVTRESDRHVGYRSGSSCVDTAVTGYLLGARPAATYCAR